MTIRLILRAHHRVRYTHLILAVTPAFLPINKPIPMACSLLLAGVLFQSLSVRIPMLPLRPETIRGIAFRCWCFVMEKRESDELPYGVFFVICNAISRRGLFN